MQKAFAYEDCVTVAAAKIVPGEILLWLIAEDAQDSHNLLAMMGTVRGCVTLVSEEGRKALTDFQDLHTTLTEVIESK